jgi:hypothetical protein
MTTARRNVSFGRVVRRCIAKYWDMHSLYSLAAVAIAFLDVRG